MKKVELVKADRLKRGDVIDHWIHDRTVIGKAIEKVSDKGNSRTIDFVDGTRDTVLHFVPVFVRVPRFAAQKNVLLDMIDDRRARKWRSVAGRPLIKNPHIPLGWVPPDWVDVLRELHTEGRVSIKEFDDQFYLVREDYRE